MSADRLTEKVTFGHLSVEPLPGPGDKVRMTCANCEISCDVGPRFGLLTQSDMIAGFAQTHAGCRAKAASGRA